MNNKFLQTLDSAPVLFPDSVSTPTLEECQAYAREIGLDPSGSDSVSLIDECSRIMVKYLTGEFVMLDCFYIEGKRVYGEY